MENKTLKRIIIFICAIIMAFSTTMLPAFAALGESAVKTITLNGYTYSFDSLIHNEEKGRLAFQTNARVTNSNYLPTGYMGVNARLYSAESGAMVKESGYYLNQENECFILNSEGYDTSSGYYYSRGIVKLWNGKDYNVYTSERTPDFSSNRAYTVSSDKISIQRNQKGEIYGSELFLNEIGVQPDLILAQGNNNIIGYVRADELNDDGVYTPDDAAAYMMNRQPRFIPLYASDGETVIGTFVSGQN